MADTVVIEGATLNETLTRARTSLGVASIDELSWDYVREHFRGGAWTVRLTAGLRSEAEREAIAAARERVDGVRVWVQALLHAIGVEAVVSVQPMQDGLRLLIDSPADSSLIIGKEGKNLDALRVVLAAWMARNGGDTAVQIDVTGDRDRRDGRRDRGDRSERGERGEGREHRADGRGHGERGGRDGRDRGRSRDGRRRDGDRRDPERDAAIAEAAIAAARKALETGEPQRLESMNSYERHVAHDAVKTVEGVVSRSVGDDDDRRVEVAPA